MTERDIIIDQLKFQYEGLFNLEELYILITSWFHEKGYDFYERMNQEQITSSGKQIRIILEPWKGITEYYKLCLRLKIHLIDISEVDIEHNGETLNLNQGTIRIMIDAYIISDWRGKWEKKPLHWFLSVLFNKFIFNQHYNKAKNWIEQDVEDLYHQIKSFLNVFKYKS